MAATTLNRERECDSFVPYSPGKSPQDHDEMDARQASYNALERIAKAQSSIADLNREMVKMEDRIQGKVEKWRIEDGKKQDRQYHVTLVMQFLLSLLAAVVALVAAKLLPFWQ